MRKSITLWTVLIALVSLCLVFASCDSGSSDSDNPTPPPAPTPTTVAVESVSLDKAALVLKTGTYGTLTATVLPENATDKSVTWSSDNNGVATVDGNGKVTGVTAGTATITVTTTDGAKTDTCEVTVTDKVYTVIFDVQGHGTAPENQYVKLGEKVTEPTEPTATGYTFGDWYKEATYTTPWDFGNDTINEEKAITLYAKWTAVYKVSFVGNNGGSDTMEPAYVEAGTSYTIPANGFTAPKIPTGAVNEDAAIPFKCWNDGTSDITSATITVNSNITLTAQWAKPYFSVSSTERVYFAKGNLTYDVSASTNKWKFYEHQYDCATGYDASLISLFTWGYDATKSIDPDGTDYVTGHTTDGKSFDSTEDWGTQIGDGSNWRTLTKDEWTYLFNERTVNGDTGEDKSYSLNITYGGKMGLVLYPDDYTGDVISSTVTELPAGCVFLPAAGYRDGSSVINVGSSGYYWSATPLEGSPDFAYSLSFDGVGVYPDRDDSRYLGQSVRLVCGED